jgi:hypothetical protein
MLDERSADNYNMCDALGDSLNPALKHPRATTVVLIDFNGQDQIVLAGTFQSARHVRWLSIELGRSNYGRCQLGAKGA